MKKTLITLFALCALAVAGTSARADVLVGQGGETLFVLRSDSDLYKSADDRANDVYDRLRLILNNPYLRGSDIQVKPMGNYGAKIVANGQLIVPIGKAEAEANNSTPMGLAKVWAANLAKVMPKLNARPDLFVMANSYIAKAPTTDLERTAAR
ncbi:MAG: hypothetical protein QM758_03395 [Armatimonas sp.]